MISLHICDLETPNSSGPAAKKRRLGGGVPDRSLTNGHAKINGTSSKPASGDDPILLEIRDISVVVPQRKKYTLCFTPTHLYASLPDSKEPVPGISFAWKDIGNNPTPND